MNTLAKQIAIGLHTESKNEKSQRLADVFKSAGAKRLTEAQRTVLARFDSINAGAVLFEGRWLFKQHIRDEPETAERMVERFASGHGVEFKSPTTLNSPIKTA